MGPFPPSFNNKYILLAVDYVSKWVEVISTTTNDAKFVLNFLWKYIFSRFEIPREIISDEKTYFCNKLFDSLLAKYGVNIGQRLHTILSPMDKLKFLTEKSRKFWRKP